MYIHVDYGVYRICIGGKEGICTYEFLEKKLIPMHSLRCFSLFLLSITHIFGQTLENLKKQLQYVNYIFIKLALQINDRLID